MYQSLGSTIAAAVGAGALALTGCASPGDPDHDLDPVSSEVAAPDYSAVTAAVERLEPWHDESGFASAELDYEAGTVTLWWVGEVPADLRALEGVDAAGVETHVNPAEFTFAALDAAAVQLLDYGRLHDIPLGVVHHNRDGSGLTVEIAPEAEGTDAEARLRDIVQVPLTFDYRPIDTIQR